MAERNKVVEVVGPPDGKTCAWDGCLSADTVSSERFLEFQLWPELYMKGTFEESLLGPRPSRSAELIPLLMSDVSSGRPRGPPGRTGGHAKWRLSRNASRQVGHVFESG
jgi:hypothetical protein